MEQLYSIGEVSKIKDITIKALRYYHKEGILIPKYIDEVTGYRFYSLEQFIYIDIIKGCRVLGTSIDELRKIFKECNTNQLIEFLNIKKVEAEKNIIKMQEIIKNIEELSNSIEKARVLAESSEIRTISFKERPIIIVPCNETGYLKEVLYYSELDRIAQVCGIEISMERGIIYDIDLSGKVKPAYVFSTFQGSEDLICKDNLAFLPEGKYLTVAYNKDNESERVEELIKYVKQRNIKVKCFLEIELFNDLFNTETFSCQIQMCVEEENSYMDEIKS